MPPSRRLRSGERAALAVLGISLVALPALHGSESAGATPGPQERPLGQESKALGKRSLLTCDLSELVRYTPVGGLQPGVLCGWQHGVETEDSLRIVDAGFNLGTRGASDGLLGVRWRRRSWALAEAGVQVHALTDTSDQWRTGRLQSSLSFALQNRPDADYYRRSGVALFATAQPSPRLLVGAEYRLEDYSSLRSRDGLWVLPRQMEIVRRNPAIEEGRMGSLLLRLEWANEPFARKDVGDAWRHPEESLVRSRAFGEPGARLRLQGWTTFEIARPALGSDDRLDFARLIGEQRLEVTAGPLRGLRLRGRGAISSGAPPQKEEALGGWNALRGFGFNVYRGDASVLGSLEYHRGRLAVFSDAGAVREPAGWSGLLAGAGADAEVWRGLHVAAAWPLTSPRRAFPSVRVLFTGGW